MDPAFLVTVAEGMKISGFVGISPGNIFKVTPLKRVGKYLQKGSTPGKVPLERVSPLSNCLKQKGVL